MITKTFFSKQFIGTALLSSGLLFQGSAFAVSTSEKSLMDSARALYGQGQIEESIEAYNKIPTQSDYWVEALEEKAWAYLRKGDNNKALSTVTAVTSELLAPQLGPEPYFLKALVDYRLCKIKGIFQDFELFKKRMKQRNDQLDLLQKNKNEKVLNKALSVMSKNKKSFDSLKADHFGAEMIGLPHYFYRDPAMRGFIANSQTEGATKRLIELAKLDTEEIKEVLQKMHLLESQVVQQVYAYSKEMTSKHKAKFEKKDKDSLIFAMPDDEDPWLDEIDKMEAATTNCPVDPFKGVEQ